MNLDQQLKLQAYVDGELSPGEAAQVEQWLAKDAAAQQLAARIRATASMLRENEPAPVLPESREFYWAQIAREIEHLEKAEERAVVAPAWGRWLRRWVAPLAGVAGLAALVMITRPGDTPEAAMAKTSQAIPGTISFYLQDEDVTIVWIDTGMNSGFTPTPSDGSLGIE